MATENTENEPSDATAKYPPRVRKRARKACLYCRSRKVRCDVSQKGPPCMNCYLDDETCVVTGRASRWYVLHEAPPRFSFQSVTKKMSGAVQSQTPKTIPNRQSIPTNQWLHLRPARACLKYPRQQGTTMLSRRAPPHRTNFLGGHHRRRSIKAPFSTPPRLLAAVSPRVSTEGRRVLSLVSHSSSCRLTTCIN